METLKGINRVVSYISHYLAAGDEHSVHSPFVFNLLTDGVYLKKTEPVFKQIEAVRKQLEKDDREINVKDLGAGSSFDGRPNRRSILDITARFAKSPAHCKFLFRIARHLKPKTMIELGTSLGISAMYQSAGNNDARLYTLEGCPETANVARENFRNNNFYTINCITGNFDDTLPILLQDLKNMDYAYIDGNHTLSATLRYFHLLKYYHHQHSVIIFDDIYWSDEMQQAWQEIKSDKDVTISLDFYQFGIIFFNKDFTPQSFKLRL